VVDRAVLGSPEGGRKRAPFGMVEPPRGCSSVGRASASQAEGRGFESRRPLWLHEAVSEQKESPGKGLSVCVVGDLVGFYDSGEPIAAILARASSEPLARSNSWE
jgi:hypothetical protein